ncbi:MAG: hypothetical protein H7A51_14630 [Akkermansiaceae bacterium]|nr:hypothetical protein [Akkermansiaceae bacterium]
MIFPETTEFGEDIEILLSELEAASEDRELTREERAVIDVVDTIRLIEGGEGLHEFWQTDLDHSRIMNSFDLVGAERMVDAIKAGQWCETRLEDRSLYTETEADYLSELEEEMYEAIAEVPEILVEFVEDGLESA